MSQIRTHVRFVVAGVVGLVAVTQVLRTLPMLSTRAPLAAGALLCLAVLTIAGLASLWRARLRAEQELDGLAQHPATGALVTARRTRLAELAAHGATPDRDALAELAAASERGRAYLGRYLVAVAVLIGLIGTFAGLAAALRGLPEILSGVALDPQRLATLLQAPLGGLDVTFAAGIVGILSTLALSLAQGDLQLAEERMLARLEEETTHELIPTLWPRAQSVEERMLRELSALREENRTLLVEASAIIGARVAEVSAKSTNDVTTRLVATVEASTNKLAAEVQRSFAAAMRAHADEATSLRSDSAAQLATLKQGANAFDRAHDMQTKLATELKAGFDALQGKLVEHAATTQRTLTEQAHESASAAASAVESLSNVLLGGLATTRVELVQSLAIAADTMRTEGSASRTALEESTARALTALEHGAASLHVVVADASQTLAEQIGGAAATIAASAASAQEGLTNSAAAAQRCMIEGMADTQKAIANGVAHAQAAITDGVAHAQTAITDGVALAQSSMADGVALAQTTLADSIALTQTTLADGAVALQAGAGEELAAVRGALVEATQAAHASLAESLEAALARLETLLATSRSELTDTLGAGRDAVDRLVSESVGALSMSASTLAQSAESLARTNDQLTPQLEVLAPELRALTQEVALLGTRSIENEEPLFADELVRLGEGMERLEALVRLAQSHGEGARG